MYKNSVSQVLKGASQRLESGILPKSSSREGEKMSLFNQTRLTNAAFKLDVERMRRGWYSDKYFENVEAMLETLAAEHAVYDGQYPSAQGAGLAGADVGNMEVEMQWFTRRPGKTLVVGVDKALSMLRHCTGYFDGERYLETW